jgi:hypothetical protein
LKRARANPFSKTTTRAGITTAPWALYIHQQTGIMHESLLESADTRIWRDRNTNMARLAKATML